MHLRSARRLCELCCANRGTFIKVGQHLGALDYLLPEEYTSTLKVLHSQAPQSSMQEVRQVIREDLGKEVAACVGRDEPWMACFGKGSGRVLAARCWEPTAGSGPYFTATFSTEIKEAGRNLIGHQ